MVERANRLNLKINLTARGRLGLTVAIIPYIECKKYAYYVCTMYFIIFNIQSMLMELKLKNYVVENDAYRK